MKNKGDQKMDEGVKISASNQLSNILNLPKSPILLTCLLREDSQKKVFNEHRPFIKRSLKEAGWWGKTGEFYFIGAVIL